ncbi:HNH endonuclease [Candidatus Methylopumilus planktonicus]|uniref:HNH endonuclease n=1 Tax=Candidatus Methylopumilus planktonicus TaxID=1581557 RepID=UPI00167BA512|nr:HNH endonuclease signature motif containing protein [Candidatus Methylopumilus planktonicus]
MIGKIRKKLLPPVFSEIILDPVICPICGRSIPESQKDAHHLIPKSKGGKSFEYIHRICHKQIHALFKENELAKVLNTAESLRNHSDMQTFINWVKNKPDDFYERAAKSSRIKKQ